MSSVCVCVCVCVLFSINIVISGVYSLAPACDKKKKKISEHTQVFFECVGQSFSSSQTHTSCGKRPQEGRKKVLLPLSKTSLPRGHLFWATPYLKCQCSNLFSTRPIP